jgi:hypothetical protein
MWDCPIQQQELEDLYKYIKKTILEREREKEKERKREKEREKERERKREKRKEDEQFFKCGKFLVYLGHHLSCENTKHENNANFHSEIDV